MNQGKLSARDGTLWLKLSLTCIFSRSRMSKEGSQIIQSSFAGKLLPEKGCHLESIHNQAQEAQLGRTKSVSGEAVNGEHNDRVYSGRGP